MSGSRRRLGNWGESVAALQLEHEGYTVLERNWRCASGEIDIIAQEGEEMVFVEVKTRRGREMGTPEEGLTDHKAQKLIELARLYLAEHDIYPDWRVDLIAIELDKKGRLIRSEHIRNAVLGW